MFVTFRAVAVAALFSGAMLAQTALAGSASAVTPTCNSTNWSYQGAWVPATSSGNVNCNMVRGNYSDGVRQLQDSMNDCYASQLRAIGVFPLVQDGDFGGNTRRALIKVQQTAGTAADGEYGPNTRRAMLHVTPVFGDPCKRVT
jgi:hypothetical protein